MESQRWCYIIKHRLGKSHDLFRLLSKGWKVCTVLKIHCFLIDFWLPFLVGHLHLFFGVLNTCTAIYIIALLELMKSKYWSLSKKPSCSGRSLLPAFMRFCLLYNAVQAQKMHTGTLPVSPCLLRFHWFPHAGVEKVMRKYMIIPQHFCELPCHILGENAWEAL